MMLMVICRRYTWFSFTPIRRSSSKVLENPTKIAVETKLTPRVTISKETIEHLERLSLVNLANERGIKRLEEAVRFADRLSTVDTTGVEPLTSVLEDEVLRLRNDEAIEGGDCKLVMSSAELTVEGYYVAPPGNIPLDPKDLESSN